MNDVNVYVAVPDIKIDLWNCIIIATPSLDKNDFLNGGYLVDGDQFPLLPQSQSLQPPMKMVTRSSMQSLVRRVGKRPLDEEDKEAEVEEEEAEDEIDVQPT